MRSVMGRNICSVKRRHKEKWSWSRQCILSKVEPATAPRPPSHQQHSQSKVILSSTAVWCPIPIHLEDGHRGSSNQPCNASEGVNPSSWDGTDALLLPLSMQRPQQRFKQPNQAATRNQKSQVKINVVETCCAYFPHCCWERRQLQTALTPQKRFGLPRWEAQLMAVMVPLLPWVDIA